MLHARISDAKKPTVFSGRPPVLRRTHERELPYAQASAQSPYSNQAVLRMLNSPFRSHGQLRRKSGCGGSSAGGQQKDKSIGDRANLKVPLATLANTSQLPDPAISEDKYSSEGVLMTRAGSGTCVNGGGDSVCDPKTGNYPITLNTNTCCTRGCTVNHEVTHATEAGNWGCCRALSVAYNKAATVAEKNAAVTKYNNWMASGARDLTECHAYSNDIVCANELEVQKDCKGAGKDSACCKDIAEYRTKYTAAAKMHCDRAPKDPPPCPAF